MENNVYRDPGERCIFPIAPHDKYAKPADSARAIQYFLRYLRQKPDELEVKWLLNIADMTTGAYPSGVPPQYLLDPKLFQSAGKCRPLQGRCARCRSKHVLYGWRRYRR